MVVVRVVVIAGMIVVVVMVRGSISMVVAGYILPPNV